MTEEYLRNINKYCLKLLNETNCDFYLNCDVRKMKKLVCLLLIINFIACFHLILFLINISLIFIT